MDRGAWWATVHGVSEWGTTELSKMDGTAERGWIVSLCLLEILQGSNHSKNKERQKPCLSKRIKDSPLPLLLRQGRHYTCAERLLGVESWRTIPSRNESCFSQKPSLRDPSWPRCACIPQGRVLRQINWMGEDRARWLAWGKTETLKTPPL